MNYPAHRIAAVSQRACPVNNFQLFEREWINRDGVLQMAAAVNRVVHPYPIHHQQHPVGFKTPYHRAATSKLGFLDVHPA